MKTKKVDKTNYEVYEYMNGYFGICESDGHGGGPVYGGDSACEDHYDKEFIESVYENWDGTLTFCGAKIYGEDGYVIEL